MCTKISKGRRQTGYLKFNFFSLCIFICGSELLLKLGTRCDGRKQGREEVKVTFHICIPPIGGLWGFICSCSLHLFRPHPEQRNLESGFGVPDATGRYKCLEEQELGHSHCAQHSPSIYISIFKIFFKKSLVKVSTEDKHEGNIWQSVVAQGKSKQ